MLGAVYLAIIVVPLLLMVAAVTARVLRAMDRVGEPPARDGLADVMPLAAPAAPAPAERSEPVAPSLPIGFRYDAVAPGRLQLVDEDEPTTKICPDCAETVLGSARVCRHCRFRFEPPLRGSHAV